MVITDWPPARSTLDEPLAAARVELGHHVVEQHQRRRAALGRQLLALGEQQRQQAEPLLAARAVGAQLAAVAAEGEVVAVRAVAGEAALEVAVDALGQLGGERLGVLRPSSAAGSASSASPSSPTSPACVAKRGRRRSTASARSRISAIPWRASSASQAGSEPAAGAAGADRGEQRVALRRARRA